MATTSLSYTDEDVNRRKLLKKCWNPKGQTVLLFRGDVADEQTVSDFVHETYTTFNRIDSVILNAASGALKPLMDQDSSSFKMDHEYQRTWIIFSIESR